MTPSEGKDSDSSDSRKTVIIVLTCSVDSFGFFLFSFLSPSVVVVDFIGTMKSKLLSSFFSSVTFLIVVINLPLYIGLLQFCGVSFFLFF